VDAQAAGGAGQAGGHDDELLTDGGGLGPGVDGEAAEQVEGMPEMDVRVIEPS
jgi:hypothetical protein